MHVCSCDLVQKGGSLTWCSILLDRDRFPTIEALTFPSLSICSTCSTTLNPLFLSGTVEGLTHVPKVEICVRYVHPMVALESYI